MCSVFLTRVPFLPAASTWQLHACAGSDADWHVELIGTMIAGLPKTRQNGSATPTSRRRFRVLLARVGYRRRADGPDEHRPLNGPVPQVSTRTPICRSNRPPCVSQVARFCRNLETTSRQGGNGKVRSGQALLQRWRCDRERRCSIERNRRSTAFTRRSPLRRLRRSDSLPVKLERQRHACSSDSPLSQRPRVRTACQPST